MSARVASWVVPELWPAPFFAQVGDEQCPTVGLGAQCQRPLGHDDDHVWQGCQPDGSDVSFGAWGSLP